MKRIDKITRYFVDACISKRKIAVNFVYYFHVMLLFTLSSCEDFVTIDPPVTEIVSETVYESDATAIAAVRGIYVKMMTGGLASGSASSITNLVGLSSDDVVNFSQSQDRIEFNANSLTPGNGSIANLWNEAYAIIYCANSVLEGLQRSLGVTHGTKNQLEGEVRFIRAFIYFYLVNLFGDVPLISQTDYRSNNIAVRTPSGKIFHQVIGDLQKAQVLLNKDYSFSKGERVQPNFFAATSLLARTYLYLEDWKNAEAQATIVIDNIALYALQTNLNAVFLANSKEAIWQLKPVVPGRNTNEAGAFINGSTLPTFQALNDQFVNTFEIGDGRRVAWIDSIIANGVVHYHPYKYKINKPNQPLAEYSMVLRLAEQYLIRAEARAELDNIEGAQEDLNNLRNRADLDDTKANDRSSLLLAIARERRVEFFTEWGHRWLDLKRSGTTEIAFLPIDSKDWQLTDILYPIPQAELEINANLTQNEGY